ncbi:MAG TPA: hypothetical protein VF170_17110, partial [Planctomycetaceae bacterium]
PNPQEANGIINLLIRLEDALRSENDAELNRLAPLIDAEIGRFGEVRAEVSSRLRTLEEIDGRLQDRDLALQEALQNVFEVDIAEVITEVTYRQATLEATLRVSAQTMPLLLINYL